MSILAAYLILSFLFSILVIGACVMSSRISQREKLVEVYVQEESPVQLSRTVSRSSW